MNTKKKLEKEIFTIDSSAYVDRLCQFIRSKFTELHRDGILVPFSGGLDSSTVLLLCIRAVGAENVVALLMPEKQGNPEAMRYSRLVTDQYKVRTITRDISSVLSHLGTYRFALSRIPFRALQDWLTKRYMRTANENPFLQIVRGQANALQRKGFAKINTKHRVRAVMIYQIAEEMNYMVVGCAHKSEDMLGLYVKFGVDDSADLMPLKNLYRSHILQLAAFLGVPDAIMNRTPNPDIIPGVSDKYMDILGLSYEVLDLMVNGIEQGLDNADIASQLNLPLEKVQQIREVVEQTDHMRHPSQSLTWE
jgi:NAD+ synthase